MLGVSQAVQDTARLHQAAKLAAAVALPPPPAASAPGMAGNVGRASVADLFTATPPVFGPTSAGKQKTARTDSSTVVVQFANSIYLLFFSSL